MHEWDSILATYAAELRKIEWLHSLAQVSDDPQVIAPSDQPQFLDHDFWSQRTHDLEARVLETLSDENIDRIFNDVSSVMDEDLARFNPVLDYFGHFYSNPIDEGIRRDSETEMAHAVKRDLAWIAVERVINQPGFFGSLLPWYRLGRWPCGWLGIYPDGHVLCL